MSKKDLPKFPITIMPTSIKESTFRNFIVGDFKNEQDINGLLLLMFEDQECNYYYFVENYFVEKDTSEDSKIAYLINRGDIRVIETQFYWYKHPKAEKKDYFVHLYRPKEEYQFKWEKELVDKGPMYARKELKLSKNKSIELEIAKKIYYEEAIKKQKRDREIVRDIFLSYSTHDKEIAEEIYTAVMKAGGKAFLSKKSIEPGSDFEEEIRVALIGSDELWIIISPNSIKSEWVISEWGAGWVLKKKIVPILYQCPPVSLPDRLKKLQSIDFHKYQDLINNREFRFGKKK